MGARFKTPLMGGSKKHKAVLIELSYHYQRICILDRSPQRLRRLTDKKFVINTTCKLSEKLRRLIGLCA